MSATAFLRAREGGVSVLTALSSVALIGFAGLATDIGSVYLDSRRLQGAVDLAALAAMQDIGQAESLAAASIAASDWPPETRVRVERGAYTANRAIAPENRFRGNAAAPNAVRIEVTTSTPLFFGRLFVPSGRMTIVRRATACQTRLASFQIGSRLLSLQGGVANQVLSGLTGSNVNLSVMDYNALLRADVDLLTYVDALRTRLDLEAASFDDTLSTHMEAPLALEALADVVGVQDARAERALREMAAASERAAPLRGLSHLIDLGPYGAQDHVLRSGMTEIRVSAMDMATAILQLANGERQVQLDLNAGVPGIASTDVWLAIGERPNNSPWLSVTDDEDVIIRTAQMRLYVEANVLGGGGVGVRVPLLLEMAAAQARLEDIQCSANGRARHVDLSVAPGIGALSLGELDTRQLDNFRAPLSPAPAQLADLGVARVEGSARIDVGGERWNAVRFSRAEIERNAVKSVQTRDAVQATVSSLLGRTDLRVRAGGFSLGTGALTNSVRVALTAASAPLDGLLNGLSDLLGVRLGEADVRVNGVRCGGAALVA
ncbi:MAG: pilus assembly protein TadG-related protein [Hyphomonadaceae bacterium]